MTWEYVAEHHEVMDATDHTSICMVLANQSDHGRLIAAAPELLGALEEMLANHPRGSWPPRCVRATLAIAKARGEA